jgi:hypothetical protein
MRGWGSVESLAHSKAGLAARLRLTHPGDLEGLLVGPCGEPWCGERRQAGDGEPALRASGRGLVRVARPRTAGCRGVRYGGRTSKWRGTRGARRVKTASLIGPAGCRPGPARDPSRGYVSALCSVVMVPVPGVRRGSIKRREHEHDYEGTWGRGRAHGEAPGAKYRGGARVPPLYGGDRHAPWNCWGSR